jgi:TrkA domain protein
MPEVFETPLPGVGVRYELHTRRGDRLGVLAHRAGRYELVVFDRDDPDSVVAGVHLEREDAQVLVDLLGGSRIVERLGELRQQLTGVSLDWITVATGAPAAGQTIAESALRTRTGASVVAIIRGETTVPAPGPEERLEPGDIVVVVGTDEGIAAADAQLRGS